MILYKEAFAINMNSYVIISSESRRRYQLALFRQASVEDLVEERWIEIFVIQQGDYVWNSTAESAVSEDGSFSVLPCVKYLKLYSKHFDQLYPAPLTFTTLKKASQFSRRVCKRPLRLTAQGPYYPKDSDSLGVSIS
jgi:hypothetical protein